MLAAGRSKSFPTPADDRLCPAAQGHRARRVASRLPGTATITGSRREGGDPPPRNARGAPARTQKTAWGIIELELPLPGLHLKDAEAASYHDLSPHPWAGLPVEIRLVAVDALGQTGESEPVRTVLPERGFRHPVARAIIDQRKELAKDPGSAEAVAEILGDLNQRPALYRDDAVVILACG